MGPALIDLTISCDLKKMTCFLFLDPSGPYLRGPIYNPVSHLLTPI